MAGGTITLRNPGLIGFRPLDGGPDLPVGDWTEGCPQGRAAGIPTSVRAVYAQQPRSLPPAGARMAQAGEWLPYLAWDGLGEGGTPLIPLPPPVPFADLRIKAEWMNPTGSHKDRMSPLVVARTKERGARGVICASSGNAALSLAAYAARAGIACCVVVGPTVPGATRTALQRLGARMIATDDGIARWAVLRRLVDTEAWYPATNYALPAVGSNAWGVEGYRTLAFELAAEMPEGIDAVVVPTARGDTAHGLATGFQALREAGLWRHGGPRIVAVEPFARISAVLAGAARSTDAFPGQTRQASIAGDTTTDQAVRAVRDTHGMALVIEDAAAFAAQATLASDHGLLLELCAAATFAALPRLAGMLASPGRRVVLIGTASTALEAAQAATRQEIAA